MIADLARQAWAESPRRVVAAVAAVPIVVVAIWILFVVAIVGLGS